MTTNRNTRCTPPQTGPLGVGYVRLPSGSRERSGLVADGIGVDNPGGATSVAGVGRIVATARLVSG
jgi:hypothetical protein